MITEEQKTQDFQIELFPIRHRNALQWAILAPYDPLLKQLLKATNLVRWSQSKRLWYMPYSDSHIFKLQMALDGFVHISWRQGVNHKAYNESFHYFTFSEIKNTLNQAPTLKHQVILFLAYITGFDLDGLSKMMITHWRGENLLMVKVALGKPLFIPISKKGSEILNQYLKAFNPTKFFFENDAGKPLSPRELNQLLKSAFTSNKMHPENISSSLLRHSLLQHLLDRGLPSSTILMFLGKNTTVVWEDLLLIDKLVELQENLFH